MKKIKNILNEIFESNDIAGMSVAITDANKTLGVYNFGVESTLTKTAVTNDSTFRIASITKIITGLTTMRLVESGKLSLDCPIGEYVEWLKPPFSTLTLKSLLSHTAGLPKEYTPSGPKDESLLENSLKEELSKVDVCLVGNDKPYLYSNVGIRLVSLIIERVSGERYSKVAENLVLKPLKMTNTTFSLDEAKKQSLSLPHVKKEQGLVPVESWENAVRLGAGGLFSTSEQLCKLARLIINDGKNDDGEIIVNSNTMAKMLVPIAEKGMGDFYGLTMMLHKFGDRLTYGHLGSAPPYYANLVCDKQSGYGVAVLINTEGNASLRYEITDKILKCLTNE